MSKIYKGYNSKITSTSCDQLALCNCRVKEECPMDGKWKTMDAIYDCRVSSPELQKIYFELAEKKWKKWYYNHKKSFNQKRYSHETTLSSFAWDVKEALGATPNLKCSIVRCATSYSNISKSFFCVCMKNWLLLPIQDNTNF